LASAAADIVISAIVGGGGGGAPPQPARAAPTMAANPTNVALIPHIVISLALFR
jgi:hypothetical protein